MIEKECKCNAREDTTIVEVFRSLRSYYKGQPILEAALPYYQGREQFVDIFSEEVRKRRGRGHFSILKWRARNQASIVVHYSPVPSMRSNKGFIGALIPSGLTCVREAVPWSIKLGGKFEILNERVVPISEFVIAHFLEPIRILNMQTFQGFFPKKTQNVSLILDACLVGEVFSRLKLSANFPSRKDFRIYFCVS